MRPLGESAAAILSGLDHVQGNNHVLPGLKDGEHLKEIKRVWYAVRHAAGLEDLRLHDPRHSYASVQLSAANRYWSCGRCLATRGLRRLSDMRIWPMTQ
jgi:hypothetical protein